MQWKRMTPETELPTDTSIVFRSWYDGWVFVVWHIGPDGLSATCQDGSKDNVWEEKSVKELISLWDGHEYIELP